MDVWILNIETATTNCSVSISKNGELINCQELNTIKYKHQENLHNLIQESITKCNINLTDLSGVAVSKGPGSFTGLRIGVAAAKGLCFALQIPLISINTLTILSQNIKVKKGTLIAPMIDARRMEVYTQLQDYNYKVLRTSWSEILNLNSFNDFLYDNKIIAFGLGSEKCKDIISHKNFSIGEINSYPTAKNMVKFSFEKWNQNQFEDIAYFEPYYLKDFYSNLNT
tara:strand:+ start:500 stop:1177 length:678 start_codon:yes stop_codon:yes gene_type:complete